MSKYLVLLLIFLLSACTVETSKISPQAETLEKNQDLQLLQIIIPISYKSSSIITSKKLQSKQQ